MKKRNNISIYNWSLSNHLTVEINSEEFENIPAPYRWDCKNCNFRFSCQYRYYNRTIRKYDCMAKQATIYNIFSIFSAIVLLIFSASIWYTMPWLNALAIIGIGTLIMYIICYIIEDIVSYFWNYTFYNTVKKLDEKNKEIEALNESKKIQEEKERIEALPYHKQIENSINLVNNFNCLLKNNDFVSCKKHLNQCKSILNEIITILKENNDYYPRVKSLFEIELPELYNLLVQYSAITNANCVDKEINSILNNTIENFLCYLKDQKTTVILANEDLAKISFKASSEAINNMIGGYEYEFKKK